MVFSSKVIFSNFRTFEKFIKVRSPPPSLGFGVFVLGRGVNFDKKTASPLIGLFMIDPRRDAIPPTMPPRSTQNICLSDPKQRVL